MKQAHLIAPGLSALLAILSQGFCQAQTTVFNDTFSDGSTLNSETPVAPTSDSASYEYLSSSTWNNASIAPGDMDLAEPSESKGYNEVESQFTTSPITLATVGDYLELNVTFVDTENILSGASPKGEVAAGLFNSEGGLGNAPIGGGLNGTLTSADTGAASGGAQNWVGYNGAIAYDGGHGKFISRPMQTGTGNNNQEVLIGSAASSSYGYDNSGGTTYGQITSVMGALTAADTYTLSYQITLNAGDVLAISENLYNGTGTGGTAVTGAANSTTVSSPLTTTFDSLAFGWLQQASVASTMDVSQVQVVDDIQPVPEPSAFALAGLGLVFLAGRFHRKTI